VVNRLPELRKTASRSPMFFLMGASVQCGEERVEIDFLSDRLNCRASRIFRKKIALWTGIYRKNTIFEIAFEGDDELLLLFDERTRELAAIPHPRALPPTSVHAY